MAALLMAPRAQGERPSEMVGFPRTMRARALAMPDGPTSLTQRTGGDGAHTFNVSTAAALVIAGAGVSRQTRQSRRVSRSGSADVFEALGLNLSAPATSIVTALREANIAFFFAPMWHPSMRHAGPTRKELGSARRSTCRVRSRIQRARRQLIGVSRPNIRSWLRVCSASWVPSVPGSHGAEVSTIPRWATRRFRIVRRCVNTFYLHPVDANLPVAERTALAGGTAAENAKMIEALLDGERGPRRDVVLLNAGAALLIAGRAATVAEGVQQAAASIDEGRARLALQRLREVCA
jgi:anthranilate phosphoribosyltransferase